MHRVLVLLLLATLSLAGCRSPVQPVDPGAYSHVPRTIERKVAVDLGDGRRGVMTKSEVDLEDYAALLRSMKYDELDRPPRPIAVPSPYYPVALEKLKIQGNAQVYLIVNEQGLVDDARVKFASHPAFGEAAVLAVLQWRFEPMTRKGKPVKVAFMQEFPFRLP
jgi:TonB family protein